MVPPALQPDRPNILSLKHLRDEYLVLSCQEQPFFSQIGLRNSPKHAMTGSHLREVKDLVDIMVTCNWVISTVVWTSSQLEVPTSAS